MIKILFGVTGLVLVLMALHLKDVVHPLPGTLFMTYFYFLAIGGILHDYSTKRRRLGWSWAVGGTIASVPALYTWWASQTLGKVITGSAWIVCLCSVVAFALFVAVALAVVGQVPEQPRSVRGIGKEGER